ncbi:3-oxoacyl-ACP reductase FabG [Helicobacter sp.]|uniref:3-oxoacyl-ACP reductase FabG n=1 Tax=Helicobacter sp. TaxID=218 RepID=UPI0025BCEFBD|nr:3-oxoacyl-ACP reductase FabG [Helicobacter sp.]MCI5633339.1 3-oxoacyl-ACP reductase FabG [Helicobacter sp.]
MLKKVLITGSSRGIGEGIARSLQECGYEVILHGKSVSERLKQIAKELNAEYLVFDVGNTQECQAVLKQRFQEDALWGVVLNAGITDDNTFVALLEENWKGVINTNLNSFYNVLNPVLMPMVRKKQGRVIVMSSVSGIMGNRGQTNYSASKAGLIGAAKSLAIELASRNITVNVVAPGLIDTEMTQEHLFLEEIIKMIPAKRSGNVQEVANLVKFLMSEEASYITKQVIGVNGGLC